MLQGSSEYFPRIFLILFSFTDGFDEQFLQGNLGRGRSARGSDSCRMSRDDRCHGDVPNSRGLVDLLGSTSRTVVYCHNTPRANVHPVGI